MDGGRHSNGDKSFPHFLTFISNCLIAIIALLITLIFYKASDYGLMLDRVCFFSSADPYLKYLHVRYNLEIQFLVVCLIYTSRRLTDVMIMISYCKHEPDDLEALELVSFLASLVASTIIVFFSVKHVMLIGWWIIYGDFVFFIAMVLVILLIMVITVVILVRLVFGIFSPGCVWPILPAVLALPIVFIFTQGSFIKGSLIGSHGVVDLAEIKALFSYLGRFYFTLDLSFSYVHNIKGFVDSCELISKTIDVSVEVIDSETWSTRELSWDLAKDMLLTIVEVFKTSEGFILIEVVWTCNIVIAMLLSNIRNIMTYVMYKNKSIVSLKEANFFWRRFFLI